MSEYTGQFRPADLPEQASVTRKMMQSLNDARDLNGVVQAIAQAMLDMEGKIEALRVISDAHHARLME